MEIQTAMNLAGQKIEEESVMEQTLTTKEKEPSQEGHKPSERMGLKSIMQDQKRRKECS